MLDDWPVHFPGCEPIGHLLRKAFPTRWVRFHSLPESKRYPGDEDEYVSLLGRQNRVLDELVGEGASVILLTTEYSGPHNTVEVSHSGSDLQTIDRDATLWRSVAMHDLDGDFPGPSYWHVLASVWLWRPGVLDSILRLVADDAIRNVMILPPDCQWLVHPYDGGMDVILETSADRDHLKSTHAAWLSSRPDGL